jgi:DNA-binding NarL/FixJ family response regulator
MANEISVLIADDHPVVRQGLRLTINHDARCTVVAEVGDGAAAVSAIEQLRPNVAVLDIDMPKLDGLGVARECEKRRLPTALMFMTVHREADMFHAVMDLGAKGYLLKDTALTEVVSAVHAVADGQFYITPSLSGHLVGRRERTRELERKQPGLSDLTPAERRILGMIAREKSSKEIAAELFLHYRTVENRRTTICQKLGLHGHSALLKFALQHKSEL